ncbi:DUF4232 domain-containing protein [Streptomyces liangshanensis]|uniref:DUF4232 domain-containing protein n=1 Tax=Streptomyces liangshanensis TaxID=2717324 RepID=UPI0036D8EFD2
MSSIRTSRTLHTPRTRLLTAAATVALAALSLTACSDGTGTRDEGASAAPGSASTPTISATSSTPATDSDSESDATSTGDAKPADAAAPAAKHTAVQASATKKPAAAAKAVTCEGSVTKTVAAPLNRPVNHMLLTVTNTGTKTCYLYGYPAVRFGEAQSVPPVIEDSQPQAVVTLDPGQSGYASISLSATDGSGTHGRTEKSLTVYFQGRSGNESVGKGATPRLPAKGTYIDDSLQVTYWQQSMDDAISW